MPKRGQKRIEVKINKTVEKTKRAVKPEDAESTEREKLMLMRVGVTCIMVIFFALWIVNLKNEFKNNSVSTDKNSFNWEQTKADLDKAMSQVKQGLSEIKKAKEITEQNTLPREPELTPEQIILLKGKLANEAASSTAATSTKK